MNRLLILALGLLVVLLTGCPYSGYKYNEGHFPSQPVNFSDVNSMYNDVNMNSPVIEGEHYLCFSSDRNSSGADYDIVGDYFHVLWDRDEGTLTVDDRKPQWKDYSYADTMFARLNTAANELGPYSLPYYSYSGLTTSFTDLLIYAGDQNGNLDVMMICFQGRGDNPPADSGSYTGPLPVSFLNTGFNEGYVAFFGENFVKYPYGEVPEEISSILFCSDRNGDYDIFSVPVPLNSDMVDYLLADTTLPATPVEVLNSAYSDKCPFVNGKLLVFTSDRPGGYGGFDLYYSVWSNGNWSQPVNFGDRINTQYNEYRPIASIYYEFADDLLMFSSDRPGGKGGYDLYYVGIPKMIEP